MLMANRLKYLEASFISLVEDHIHALAPASTKVASKWPAGTMLKPVILLAVRSLPTEQLYVELSHHAVEAIALAMK